MSYHIQLDRQQVNIKGDYFSESLAQSHTVVTDDGFAMQLLDVSLPAFHLRHGNIRSASKRQLALAFEVPFVESHFLLSHSCKAICSKLSKTFAVSGMDNRNVERHDTPETREEYTFLEVGLSAPFFEKACAEDEETLLPFCNEAYRKERPVNARPWRLTPVMWSVVNDISQSMARPRYKQHMHQLFLEAKTTELFLLQTAQLASARNAGGPRLHAKDIDSLYAAKHYIDQHFATPCSIIDLARKVGINQMKLKNGFRQLFGNTVFGYVRDLQMDKARQMLLEEKLFVSEVADRVGYKHPHNFAVAFKRKFGILPGALKC